jgi:transcriptional regulator with XRE-family HTH domain
MNKNNLPNNLYELRRSAGLSQEEFAERLLVSSQAVSKWERGEAYPDTDNLIAISEMFGITIDELLRGENIAVNASAAGDTYEQSDKGEGAQAAGDKSFRINVGDNVVVNLNGDIEVDDEDGKVRVGFENGGITVDEEDGVRVKLGKFGISVTKNGDDDDDDDDDEDEDEDEDEDDEDSVSVSILNAAPYPVIVSCAFVALGLIFDAWAWAWTLFITIPVYYSLVCAIRRRRFSDFAYPIFVTFLYCLFGMLFSWWHPGWIIFITIAIYDPIATAIDKRRKNN